MTSEYTAIEKLKQELLSCTMCGFCKNVCPVFIEDNWDSRSPRGRMTMAYGLITGELEPDQALLDRIFQCTQCTDCSRRCPSSAKCPEVVIAARQEMVNRGHTTEIQDGLVKNVEETGNIFADLEVEFPEQEGDIPMFIGCQHLSRPNNTKKALKFMKKLGINPKIVKEVCCGFPLKVMGYEDAHQKQKERLKAMFDMNGDKPILNFCPSCQVEFAEEYDQESIHVIQEINKRLDASMVTKPVGKKVTYHDPCDLSRGAQIVDEPRELIEKIGCELIEMKNVKNTSRCCGGGGGILTWDPELSDRMSQARIEEAIATGAEMLVTTCPTCEQTLKKGARAVAEKNGGKPLPVRHLMDLMAKAVK